MDKVKVSTLSKNDVVLVEGSSTVISVKNILDDFNSYRGSEIYTTREINACFNAEEILDAAIEEQLCNGMYEDWDANIKADITKDDLDEIQAILDRILARNSSQNITYETDKLIELDGIALSQLNLHTPVDCDGEVITVERVKGKINAGESIKDVYTLSDEWTDSILNQSYEAAIKGINSSVVSAPNKNGVKVIINI